MPEPTQTPGEQPSSPTPPSASRPTRAILLALGILVVSAALRIYDVGSKDLWIDEANGVIMARQALPEFFARLKLDSSPPLYYIILRGWMRIFGDSEPALRALSILGGVALAGCVFTIGRRMFSTETAALAALLVATSPIQILYSQQARMYSLLPVLALLSTYWLWRAVAERRRRLVVAYALTTLATLYWHNYGLYLLPAHTAVLLWSGALRARPGTWLVCGGGIVAGYLPWLPTFLAQLGNQTHYSWYLPFWRAYGLSGSVQWTLCSFAPGGPQPPFVQLHGLTHLSWLPPLLFTAAALLGVVRLFRRLRGGILLDAQVGWLLSLICIPLGSALAASMLTTPNYVPGRCDQMVFPGFVLLVAVGLTLVRPFVLRYTLLAAFLVCSAIGLRQYYGDPTPSGNRAMAQAIARRARPGDAVLCTSLTRAPLEYYLGRLEAPVTFFSYPRDTAHHLGNQDNAAWLKQPRKLKKEIGLVAHEIKDTCGPHCRFFLVLTSDRINKFLREAFVASGRIPTIEWIGKFRHSGTKSTVLVLLQRF